MRDVKLGSIAPRGLEWAAQSWAMGGGLLRIEDEELAALVNAGTSVTGGFPLSRLLSPMLARDIRPTARILYVRSDLRLLEATATLWMDRADLSVNAVHTARHAKLIGAFGVLLIHHFPDRALCRDRAVTDYAKQLRQVGDEIGLTLLDTYVVSSAGWFSESFRFWLPRA